MTATLKLLSSADRTRLLKRLDELGELRTHGCGSAARSHGLPLRGLAPALAAQTTYARLLPYRHDHDP